MGPRGPSPVVCLSCRVSSEHVVSKNRHTLVNSIEALFRSRIPVILPCCASPSNHSYPFPSPMTHVPEIHLGIGPTCNHAFRGSRPSSPPHYLTSPSSRRSFLSSTLVLDNLDSHLRSVSFAIALPASLGSSKYISPRWYYAQSARRSTTTLNHTTHSPFTVWLLETGWMPASLQ